MTELYNPPYMDEIEHSVTDHTGIPGVGGGGGFTAQTTAAVITKVNFDLPAGSQDDVTFTDGVDAVNSSTDLELDVDGIHINILTAGTYVTTLVDHWVPESSFTKNRTVVILATNAGVNFATYPYLVSPGHSVYTDNWETGDGTYADSTTVVGYLPVGAALRARVTNNDPTEVQRIQQFVMHVLRIA